MKWIILILPVGICMHYKIAVKKNYPKIGKMSIQYHYGYDWKGFYRGEEVRGIKTLNQFYEFNYSDNRKELLLKSLKTVNTLRNYKDGSFGENLILDSVTMERINKKVKLASFLRVIDNIADEESLFKTTFTRELTSTNEIYSINNGVVFFLERIHRKIGSNDNKDRESFISCILRGYDNTRAYSFTEWLKVKFEYRNNEYILSQRYLGDNNFKWRVMKNNIPYQQAILSPKLNDLIVSILPRGVECRKSLGEYKKKKLYNYCLN